ncbi:MAG: hypothetical protein Ct9H300mP1_27560 [Planctomycetaceae bacterium]|nr:MAG: hypothetical protein Ct9H300mP1_27560 [Planctomycetaceae bacterium]
MVTRHEQHAERIGYITNALGLACSPFDAWLVFAGDQDTGAADGGSPACGPRRWPKCLRLMPV